MEEPKITPPEKIRVKNREQIRLEHKYLNNKEGDYTKTSLSSRKRKRRALAKVSKATKKRNRK